MTQAKTGQCRRHRLNSKWRSTDVQNSLRTYDGIDSLWNTLIEDGELTRVFTDEFTDKCNTSKCKSVAARYYCGLWALTCPCCVCISGFQPCCDCESCQQQDADEENSKHEDKSPISSSSQFLLNSWTWSPRPSTKELKKCMLKLCSEQQRICSEAASSSLSSNRLHQRMIIFKRYFIALEESLCNFSLAPSNKPNHPRSLTVAKAANESATPADPRIGLIRVGSRAALSFSFAFLKRAWRLGEDTDLCTDLLSESLEALQILPVASLFDDDKFSDVWVEIVERSMKFLSEIVSEVVTCDRWRAPIPQRDRYISLSLLLELALQKGTLTNLLESVLLLLNLWEKAIGRMDNRSHTSEGASAPLIPFLRRMKSIPCTSSDRVPKGAVAPPSPTQGFLNFLQLPDDPSFPVDLRQAAVIVIAHLDRLAAPLIPSTIQTKTAHMTGSNVFAFGWLSWANGTMPQPCEAISELDIVQICCSERSLLILTKNQTVYSMYYSSETPSPALVEGLQDKKVVKIAAHTDGRHFLALTSDFELYSWGSGDGGRLGHGDTVCNDVPTKIESLKDVVITDIECGGTYSAAISSNGSLYTWGRGNYGRLGHGNSDDYPVPTLVSALAGQRVVKVACGSGDSHTLCVTEKGKLYSWGDGDYGKLGRSGSNSKVPLPVDRLQDEFITDVYCGSQSSIALTREGKVYSWGKGDGWRLGHASAEHLQIPKQIEKLADKRVVKITLGSAHALALTDAGEVYGWGLNDLGQVSTSKVAYVHEPTLVENLPSGAIIGLCCGPTQSFVWSENKAQLCQNRLPFVLDLTEGAFKLLDELLSYVSKSFTAQNRSLELTQDKELLGVATLNLLQLQLDTLINQNIDVKSVGLLTGSKLLSSLKSQVVSLASNSGVISTVQQAAQSTLKVGWSILLPTSNERAQTLSSLLPSAGYESNDSKGRNFMTSLLVSSLMIDGGLETALNEAIQTEVAEVIDGNDVHESVTTKYSIPLLYLVKQLLKNTSMLARTRIQNLDFNRKKNETTDVTSSLNLLLKFQRLLIAHVFMKGSKQNQGAESLLRKYVCELAVHAAETMATAYSVGYINTKNFYHTISILQSDVIGHLLPELIISLILLQREISMLLISNDWLKIFEDLLVSLDRICRLIPNVDACDADNMGWPGNLSSAQMHSSQRLSDDLPLVRQADIQNHNLDGGFWIIVNNKVYDVQDIRCESTCTTEILHKLTNKDASQAFNNTTHSSQATNFMETFLVGNYGHPDQSHTLSYAERINMCRLLLDTERYIGYLLGLHAFQMRQSLNLQEAETQAKAWIKAPFLVAGLQVIQPPNPFEEEKGEARSTNSTAGNTPTDTKVNICQKLSYGSVEKINGFIYALAESRLNDPYVAAFLAIVEHHCKQNNFLTYSDFSFEHPVEEIGRVMYAVIIKHLGLGYSLVPVLDSFISNLEVDLNKVACDMIKAVHSAKWNLIKIRQELNRSYKEVCIPVLEKCRFLLYEVRPTISLEMLAFKKINVLQKERRLKSLVKNVMKNLKCGAQTSDIQKLEDIVNASIQGKERNKSSEDLKSGNDDVNNDIKNGTDKANNEYRSMCGGCNEKTLLDEKIYCCPDLKTELEEKIESEMKENGPKHTAYQKQKTEVEMYLLSVMDRITEKQIRSAQTNHSSLISSILEFIMMENNNDIVCHLRKAMYCQVQRSKIRKQGLDMILQLLKHNFLLPSVKYSILSGYLGPTNCSRDKSAIHHCLDNIDLIQPYHKVEILMAQSGVTEWCIESLRTQVCWDNTSRFNKSKIPNAKVCLNLGTYTLLRDLPKARFLLALLGILSSNTYLSDELDVLVNSGLVSLLLGLLKQTGCEQGMSQKKACGSYVVYEDMVATTKPKTNELSKEELASMMKVGTKVVRGADWKWGDQDGPAPGIGRVVGELAEDGWVRVEWPNGSTNSYRMGKENMYDLALAYPPSPASSESSSEESIDLPPNPVKINQFLKLLKEASINLLRNITICAGANSEDVRATTVHCLSTLFCSIFRSASNAEYSGLQAAMAKVHQEDWCSLPFIKSIMQSEKICRAFSSPLWVNLLLETVEPSKNNAIDMNLPKQIFALRFLSTVLPSWDLDNSNIQPTLERLLKALGQTLVTCYYDNRFDELEPKHSVLLTQSYTGTLCQEIVILLRNLHGIVGWNQALNAIAIQKLHCIAELLSSSGTFSSLNVQLSSSHYMSIAILCVIGNCDMRPRIGSTVEVNNKIATICKVTKKGKLCAQLHCSGEIRKVAISGLKMLPDITFNLDKLFFTEIAISSWASLLLNTHSSLPVSYERRNHAGFINNAFLHKQQQILYGLSAIRVLSNYQHKLRKVLCHRIVPTRDFCEQSSADDNSTNASAVLVLKKLLSAASQPNPLKAAFSLDELRLAAISLSQYLAAESNADSTLKNQNTNDTETFEESNAEDLDGSKSKNEGKNKKHRKIKGKLPIIFSPVVKQLTEMGFQRRTIENTVKNIGENPEMDLNVDTVVSWLLEHPDIALCDTESVSSSETESTSEEDEVLKPAPDESEDSCPIMFLQRADFLSNDEYAMYVRDNVAVGMLVRCCKAYEEIDLGDIGKVIEIDREGLHSLNVQVNWQQTGSTYWVRFVHVEILGYPPSLPSLNHIIKVGDRVKVKESISAPRYKWGFVTHDSVGIVVEISSCGKMVTVDFPKQSNWVGLLSEMELVPSVHLGVACQGCSMNPIRGARFKCKSCEKYNYCENCFYTKKSHPHSFNRIIEPGSAVVFSGKPGRYYRHAELYQSESLIDEWSRCVKNITVSSRERSARIDFPSGLWQSYGNQGKHWIRLEMQAGIVIKSLKMGVDPSDSSYMPSLVVVSGGQSFTNMIEFNVINVRPTDIIVKLLSNMTEYYSCIEIAIKQCRNEGIDCKVHGLSILGHKKVHEFQTSSSFLADDWDQELQPDPTHTAHLAFDDKSVPGGTASVYVWGLNDKDQLGGMKGSKVKTPVHSEILSRLRPIYIAGGSKSLFIVSQDGKLYACGEGTNGRLGLGHNNNVSHPKMIPFLNNYFIKKVAVHSGGKHAMALTADGKVFSWGEGEDGKLGHGNRLNLHKPRIIDALRNKKVRDIACGSSHCAAITSCGELYTWGLGEYGRLGHGDNCTQLKPKLVKTLLGHRIVQVACGSRDAQTLALSDEGLVFSWGDGDFGKLGRGGSEGCNVPHCIEKLNCLGVVKIECGAQFSLALTRSGQVWTWGKGDYFRLGHGSDQHVRKPTLVEGLKDKKIVHVAVGALHCLAVTATGQVFAWGDNDHGQQGNGTTVVNRKPSMVYGLDDVMINRVACGSSHSIAWTVPNIQASCKHEPVMFDSSRDPLGSSLLGLLSSEIPLHQSERGISEKKSLVQIAMSLESSTAKQQALQHILNAIHIQQLRQCVVRAFSSHSSVPVSADKMLRSDSTLEGSWKTTAKMKRENEIAQGGGEAPASLADLGDCGPQSISSPDSDDSPLAILKSMNVSSCSVSLSSRQSKKSNSTLSVIAATLTSNAEIVGYPNFPTLDEFTSLLKESDARLLVDLLKLAVANRVECESAKEVLSSLLITLGCAKSNIGEILLEICITELEDVVSNAQPVPPNLHSVAVQANHLYTDDMNFRGDELSWRFASDGSVNDWGWRPSVHPVVSPSFVFENGSDRTVLSYPSMDLVICLLDPRFYYLADMNLIVRLATALTACSQFNLLTANQRMWSLQKLRELLMPNSLNPTIPTDLMQMTTPDSAFAKLIDELPYALIRQYEYEDPHVRSGSHMMHSEFFKVLVAVACDFELDSLQSIVDSHKWVWFRRYCYAARIAKSLIDRTPLPPTFCAEVAKKISDLSLDLSGSGNDHENHDLFKKEHDEQLLTWLNRRPEDWMLSLSGAITIYGWGHNHRGQLGGVEGAKVKIPTPCEALSALRPVQLAGGEQTLLAVTFDGKVYSTGYGAFGRLGVGGTDSVMTPTIVESLQNVFVKKIAVNSGGKHCLALTADNKIYSWGEGEEGKLGHGNKENYDRPKLIESLQGIEIVDIACGGAHSAAVSNRGEVYTWGKGRYGRLGHGDSEDQLQPKLVEALQGYRVIDIACGSGDAQTLCITDDDNVWSWGDGDYGKLGRGGSDGCKLPTKIESLAGLGVIKVECGSQFSVALTRSGSVYTWGKGDYFRLGHGDEEHVRRPRKVSGLQGKKIISIATGSLHCVACSDQGEVFTWGDNDEGQLGDGTTNAIEWPRPVNSLKGKNITNVACGSAHTFAWSNKWPAARLPNLAPLEYDLVRDIPLETLYSRIVLLHHFAETICPYINMFPLSGEGSLDQLRSVLVYSTKESMFRKVVQATMVRDKQHGPVVELNRIQVKRSRSKGGLAGVDGMKSVFGQMVSKLPLLTGEVLCLSHRVWKVKFVGESVDDCGGGYSESIAEMCDELQNGSVPLLIPTPNGREEAGTNRDCFLLNPSANSALHMDMFRFLGVLMGIAVRTGSPLSLSLAEPVWKQLAGIPLTPPDITEVDRDYVPGLLCIRDMEKNEKLFRTLEMPFSTSSSTGDDVPLSNKYKRITYQNCLEYVRLALNYRLHEFDEQVKAVRDGMSRVIPVPYLSLFSGYELETMVCGSPDIPLPMLKSVATYKGIDANSPLIQWFWEVMEELSNQERSLFLRFVWGRTRLPRTIADFRGRDFVIQVLDKYSPPDHFLPESYTCFFLLKMPRYSCKVVLREKLKYAIYFCKSIDTDEYARVAMAGDGDVGSPSDTENDHEVDSIASHDDQGSV